MRQYLIIFLLVLSENLFSQKLPCDRIFNYSLADISNALYNNYKNHQYTKADIKCLATQLSAFDKLHGNKRIFVLSDMFNTPCTACNYAQVGFATTDFGAFDVATDDVLMFIQIYNSNMEKLIPVNQLNHINQGLATTNPVFVPNLTASSKFEIKKLSDTVLNLKLRNDTIEFLFQDDMKYLKISISDALNDSIKEVPMKEYGYVEIKFSGAEIVVGNENVKRIEIIYDFTDMPDNFKICWCGILEKKYHSLLPIKIN